MEKTELNWHKSSFSGTQGGNCVEVAHAPNGAVHVRNSRDELSGAELAFTPAEWDAFIKGAQEGEFDRP